MTSHIKFYFTFGQNHTHRCNGVTLDCDGVVEIKAENGKQARQIMFDTFGRKWAFQYTEETMEMDYFPRGVVLKLGSK